MSNEQKPEEINFGDYVTIEMKRHVGKNEFYSHKVVTRSRSNQWVEVPVQSPATPVLHDEMADVVWCICEGVCEDTVLKYRVCDVKKQHRSTHSALPVHTTVQGKSLKDCKNEVARRYNKKADVAYLNWHEMETILGQGSFNDRQNLFGRMDEAAELYASQSASSLSSDAVEFFDWWHEFKKEKEQQVHAMDEPNKKTAAIVFSQMLKLPTKDKYALFIEAKSRKQ